MNYAPVAEIKGALDNPLIELSHQLTFIEDGKTHENTDEIPWCSSWVNLVVALACLSVDPAKTVGALTKKGYAPNVLKAFYEVFIQIIYPNVAKGFTGSIPITLPTYSAGAISWAKWGNEVKFEDAKEGDIVVMSRVGGNHVTFLAEAKLDMTKPTFLGLGGNQADKVCITAQSTARIKQVRRA